MEASIARFPFGELEGAPALVLDVPESVKRDDLADAVFHHSRPGISVVWVRSAPWGEPEWDQAMHRMLASPQLSHMTITAVRLISEERWSPIRINWVGDVSPLLREPVTSMAVQKVLTDLRYRPELRELLVRRPAIENLKPSILDELHSALDPSGGSFIYGPDAADFLDTALIALTRCAAPWAVRIDRD